jgi:rRNA maturation endonuclease Nob1
MKDSTSDAFSVGIGLAFGLAISQSIFYTMKPSESIKQVIVCIKCGGRNSVKNKFCWQCGRSLYPPQPIECAKCGAQMSSNWNFCGICGASLKKKVKTRKKRKNRF